MSIDGSVVFLSSVDPEAEDSSDTGAYEVVWYYLGEESGVAESNDGAFDCRQAVWSGFLRESLRPAVPGYAQKLKGPDRNSRLEGATALAVIGPETPGLLEFLVETLDDEDFRGDERIGLVLIALGRMGELAAPAVPAIVKALQKADDDKVLYVECLKRIGPAARESIPALEELLASPDTGEGTRREAQEALKKIRGEPR